MIDEIIILRTTCTPKYLRVKMKNIIIMVATKDFFNLGMISKLLILFSFLQIKIVIVAVDANVAMAAPTAPNSGIRSRLNNILAKIPSKYAGARFFCLL